MQDVRQTGWSARVERTEGGGEVEGRKKGKGADLVTNPSRFCSVERLLNRQKISSRVDELEEDCYTLTAMEDEEGVG